MGISTSDKSHLADYNNGWVITSSSSKGGGVAFATKSMMSNYGI
jgi:hypothetical protein